MKSTKKDSKEKFNNANRIYTYLLWLIFTVAAISVFVYLGANTDLFRIISFLALIISCIALMALLLVIKTKLFCVEEKNALCEKALAKCAVRDLLEGKLDETVLKHLPAFSGRLSAVYVMFNSEFSKETVIKIAEKVFSQIGQVYFPVNITPGRLTFLIELFPESVEVEKTATKFLYELKARENADVDVIFGKITENTNEIAESYRRIREASIICRKSGCVLDSEKISARDYSIYDYTIDDEAGIMLYIKKGDFPKAYGLMSNALDNVLYRHGYPMYVIKCFMFEMAGTILKAIGEVEKESGIKLGVSKKLNEVFYVKTVHEMEYVLKEYLREVCMLVAENNKGVASPFCEKIKKYVKDNFYDADMNVNAIAARFYVNPAYLSNLFKRNTDMKLLDYINKVRVEEAKKMMMAYPDISVEELSEKSGFKSSRTFRRIFMKYEDVSPSRFTKN